MPQCYLCHKGNMRNLQVSHAKNRSKKIRKPNLHSYTMVVNSVNKKVKLCTKCLRKAKVTNLSTKKAVSTPTSPVSKS